MTYEAKQPHRHEIKNRPETIDTRLKIDLRLMDTRLTIEPRLVDPRLIEPRLQIEPRLIDTRLLDTRPQRLDGRCRKS